MHSAVDHASGHPDGVRAQQQRTSNATRHTDTRWTCPPASRTEEEIMKVKLDTMSLISLAIGVAIWVLVIWTAIAAIVAHI
jgi:hypothetical protein